MDYKIKGKIGFKDYKDFIGTAMIHKKYRLIIFTICFLIIISDIIERIITSSNISTAVAESVPIVVFIIFSIIVYNIFLKKSYSSDRMLQDEINLTFFKDGIHLETERGSCTYKIEDFRKFIFTKTLIIIYVSISKAILIPRHFFLSKEQEREIETYIKENYIIINKKKSIFFKIKSDKNRLNNKDGIN